MVTVEIKLLWPHLIENGPLEVAMGILVFTTITLIIILMITLTFNDNI